MTTFTEYANDTGLHKYITRTISSALFAQLGNKVFEIDCDAIADRVQDQIEEYFEFSDIIISKTIKTH
jgi:hypothetical protein